MSDRPIRTAALSALRDGRVRVVHAGREDPEARVPSYVWALVQSSRDDGREHHVDLRDGQWSCTWPGPMCPQPCAHVAAVQLVTGHQSAAAKEAS